MSAAASDFTRPETALSERRVLHDGPYAPGIDVVVVNYRTPEDLRGFIDSFVEVQFEVPATLWVVNVEPTEQDIEVAEDALAKVRVNVGYTVAPTNIGYARACNAAAHSAGEYTSAHQTVAFFNADTRLKPGVLDHCHWNLHQNTDWAVIGPKQVNELGQITSAGVFGTRALPKLRGWKERDKGQFDELRGDAVSVSGSAYFVKRKVWDALTDCQLYRDSAPDAFGAFLPTRHFYEETWCSYHAVEHGWKVAYDGQVSMVHKWHQASPIGGFAEHEMPISRKYFREACDHHGIPRD